MLIPWNTDAPIYHYPIASAGLIACNVAVFALLIGEPELAEEYCLAYGDGLHPVQWLTHNFLHADFMHLLGNMIFLWSFGLVVEGKLGWYGMLPAYLGIGIANGWIVQAANQHQDGVALGVFGGHLWADGDEPGLGASEQHGVRAAAWPGPHVRAFHPGPVRNPYWARLHLRFVGRL